jgi:hypothetical protein
MWPQMCKAFNIQGSSLELLPRNNSHMETTDTDRIILLHTAKKSPPSLVIRKSKGSPENYVLLKKTKLLHLQEKNNEIKKNSYDTTKNYTKPETIIFNINSLYNVIENGSVLPETPKENYIKSEFIRKTFLSRFKASNFLEATEHGPAIHVDLTKYGYSNNDCVPYIHFEWWPKSASEWINRKRVNN